MTIRVPKWLAWVLGGIVLSLLVLAAFLIGRSSHSSSGVLSRATAKAATCSKAAAEHATLASDFDDAIRAEVTGREAMEGRTGVPATPFFTNSPVDFHVAVLHCDDLDGDGAAEMVVGLGAGAAGRIFQWAIFSPDTEGKWRLAFDREGIATSSIQVRGDSVVTRTPTYGARDPLCCPSGFKIASVAFRDGAYGIVSPPQAPAGERRIEVVDGSVTHVGRFRPDRDSPTEALADFGPTTSISTYPTDACTYAWSDIGLAIVFANFGGGDPCGPAGRVGSIELTGKPAEQAGWTVGNSASVGLGATVLRALYPGARQHGSELVLVEAPSPYGLPGPTPIVTAYLTAGKAAAFRLQVGAAGE